MYAICELMACHTYVEVGKNVRLPWAKKRFQKARVTMSCVLMKMGRWSKIPGTAGIKVRKDVLDFSTGLDIERM